MEELIYLARSMPLRKSNKNVAEPPKMEHKIASLLHSHLSCVAQALLQRPHVENLFQGSLDKWAHDQQGLARSGQAAHRASPLALTMPMASPVQLALPAPEVALPAAVAETQAGLKVGIDGSQAAAESVATKPGPSGESLATKPGPSGGGLATKPEPSGESMATKPEPSGESMATKPEPSGGSFATKPQPSQESSATKSHPQPDTQAMERQVAKKSVKEALQALDNAMDEREGAKKVGQCGLPMKRPAAHDAPASKSNKAKADAPASKSKKAKAKAAAKGAGTKGNKAKPVGKNSFKEAWPSKKKMLSLRPEGCSKCRWVAGCTKSCWVQRRFGPPPAE